MTYQVIGTCSICGGPVQVPLIYHSIIPPTPTCGSCGAVKAPNGPVIDMQPAPKIRTGPGTGTIQDAVRRHTTSGTHWTDK